MNLTTLSAGSQPRAQAGVALLMVLTFTLLLNLLAATVIESATLQSRLAGSEQYYTEALELADGIANELRSDAANFPLALPPGRANCARSDSDTVCVSHTLSLPSLASFSADLVAHYKIVRLHPERVTLEVNEIVTDAVSLPLSVEVELFEIAVSVASSSTVAAEVAIGVGVAVPVPIDSRPPFLVYFREPGVDAL